MNELITGLKLNERFYWEVVHPLLQDEFPGLIHSAALLGSGSEILGYDDLRSTDHDWGPRLQLFISEADHANYGQAISQMLSRRLPEDFLGYSTNYGPPIEEGTRRLTAAGDNWIEHRVEVVTLRGFFNAYMAIDPSKPLTTPEWLTIPQQLLLGATQGQVYHDGLGTLGSARRRLAYYPRDIWLYLLAAQWSRIGQEEHFMGRAGQRGDELGSRLIAGRLVHDIMQLCFLMERSYAPYPKWFGTAFARLECAQGLTSHLQSVFSADGWQARERSLSQAYEQIAAMHNELGITAPLNTQVREFFDRPFLVIDAGRFSAAIKDQIRDDDVRKIETDIGSIDQFSHSTDLRSTPTLHRRLQALYT